MLTPDQRREAAELLATAERDRAPIAPLTDRWPGLDPVDAYEIQLCNIRARTDRGRQVVGHKVGLSAKVMQEMMGVDEPDYGHLLDDMRIEPGTKVEAAGYCTPRIEVEVAFVLGADLPAPGCTVEDVLAATDHVGAAIELIDSRIADWKIRIGDTIADNASSAGFVLGATRIPVGDVDVAAIGARLWRNGEQVAAGESSAVLGNPAIAVAWLANTVHRFGVRLRAGHVVLPGSCTRAFDARPGDRFRAEFDTLGDVEVTFT
jgi:2-keto-4-pentenoate hydratase